MTKFFSLTGLGSFKHTDDTRDALQECENKSKFLREAIIKFAKQYGWPVNDDCMPEATRETLKILQQKSYYINYDYIAAFWWLKSLNKFRFHSNSKLIRTIIYDQQNL